MSTYCYYSLLWLPAFKWFLENIHQAFNLREWIVVVFEKFTLRSVKQSKIWTGVLKGEKIDEERSLQF